MTSHRVAILFAGMLLLPGATPSTALAGWESLDSGVGVALNAVFFVEVDRGYAVGASGTGLRTTDGGMTWLPMEMGTMVALHDVHAVEATCVAVGDGGTIVRTTDAGESWAPVASGVSDGLRSVSLMGANGVCGGQSQTILYTTDSGATWEISQSDFFGGGFYGAAMVSPQIAFVGGQNSIFQPLAGRSTNGGASWSFASFYLNGNEGSLARIDFTDQNIGYAAATVWDGSGAIAKTTDGGVNWTSELFPQRLLGISFPISDASQVGYCVGASGTIRKTDDAGATWGLQESGTFQTLRDVHFVDIDHGYAVGDGGTILRTTTGGEPPSAAGEDPLSADLGADRILSIHPSPFRGTTEFRLVVGSGGPVELAVYDVGGRKIRSLASGRLPTGTHSFAWDGTDDEGIALRAGVYPYRLAIGEQRRGGTLVMLK